MVGRPYTIFLHKIFALGFNQNVVNAPLALFSRSKQKEGEKEKERKEGKRKGAKRKYY
jgi:hypothetical protein